MSDTGRSRFKNEEYTVGWICALPVELAAAKAMMDELHGDPQRSPGKADANVYVLGSMNNIKIVLACLPIDEPGPSSAAVVAKDMFYTFPEIQIGLLVGVGAGIPHFSSDNIRDIRLGDVVIGFNEDDSGVVAYDLGKKLADGSFKNYALNGPPGPLRSAVAALRAQHQVRGNKIPHYIEEMLGKRPYMRRKGYSYPFQVPDRLFRPDYVHVGGRDCTRCDPKAEINREDLSRSETGTDPVIHYGTIATGGTLVKNGIFREEIGKRYGAICLEMEAEGLMNIYPCIVIRGISDYADSHKNNLWRAYAAAAAAACTKELLEHLQHTQIEERSISWQDHAQVSQLYKVSMTHQPLNAPSCTSPVELDSLQQCVPCHQQFETGLWLLRSNELCTWVDALRRNWFCAGNRTTGRAITPKAVVERPYHFAQARRRTLSI
ncbi:purine and uridine phosphorylase [Aspergillus heteromorphus CBS 117.55]|uniref:Purine and uridine phosphorylase n=1 Tax=Aspergillus heteromorphus CBS 117.55 TaxID=1448321 RepID=A0A317VIH3_9EURO|nr:purine and uridine phosphorylase [Aspergillus heteromorphus CBS 117.55]PWY73031.1 purine and uridine phosphorylase [Aspergillus heteromorphus CBS 117.55]